jgi:hypothetical protein
MHMVRDDTITLNAQAGISVCDAEAKHWQTVGGGGNGGSGYVVI